MSEFVEAGINFLDSKTIKYLKDFGYSTIGYAREIETGSSQEKGFQENNDIKVGAKVIPSDAKFSKQKNFLRQVSKENKFTLLKNGYERLNKVAINEELIDGLLLPSDDGNESLDQGTVSLLSQKDIPVLISFNCILKHKGYLRSRVLRRLKNEVKISKENNIPIVITSGSKSFWGIRPPRELISFGEVLGMSKRNSKASITFRPRNIIE